MSPAADDIRALAAELEPALPATAGSLREVGMIAFGASPDTDPGGPTAASMQWSSVDLFKVFDPERLAVAVAGANTAGLRRRLHLAEGARAVLVFTPVLITWVGIGRAAAIFATCDAPAAQFLVLWQKGFSDAAYGCDRAAASFPLQLDSLGDVVKADTAVLALIIVLTIIAQAIAARIARLRSHTTTSFADRLRAALVLCARQLRPVESAKDIGALVVEATKQLHSVATDFSRQTAVMMSTLQERSDETTRSLEVLERSYQRVSETTLQATNGLTTVVDRIAATADRLAETSLSVRDELRAATEALRDSVRNSGLQLDRVGKGLTDGLSATATQLKDTTEAVRHDITAGADALRQSVKTSGDQLASFTERLREVTAALHAVDKRTEVLAKQGELAEERNESARVNINSMANALAVLPDLDHSIQSLFKEERRILAPVPAWQAYGALLLVQTFFILILVLRTGDASGPRIVADPPNPSPPTRLEILLPPSPPDGAPLLRHSPQ